MPTRRPRPAVSRRTRVPARRRGGPRRAPWLLALPAIVLLVAFHFVAQAEGAWYAFTDWHGVGAAH